MIFNMKEEQEEIMKRRMATQKKLSLNEIKQMVYLSEVSYWEFTCVYNTSSRDH